VKYLAERREGSNLGQADVRTRLASHFISFDELVGGDVEQKGPSIVAGPFIVDL
jgi:hypothetical protein